jgi:hypothetical protein
MADSQTEALQRIEAGQQRIEAKLDNTRSMLRQLLDALTEGVDLPADAEDTHPQSLDPSSNGD